MMGKKNRIKHEPEFWVVEHIDRFNPEDSFNSEPMSKAEAEREFNSLTEYGTKNIEGNCDGFVFYRVKALR